MSDDRRILGDVIGNPLVVRSLVGGLVRRHADAVADYFSEDLVFLHLGKFELLEPQVFLAIKAYRFCLHIKFVLIFN